MSINTESACSLDISLNDGRIISLKNLTGKTIKLKFEKSETTETFNLLIQDKEGNQLENEVTNVGENQDVTISNHNIQMESESDRSEVMKILVEDPEGNVIPLECDPTDTIEKVKKMIHNEKGICPLQQNLLLEGQKLEDGRTLGDYNIQHEDKIQLELNESDSPNDIKVRIQNMEPIIRNEEQPTNSGPSNEQEPQFALVKREVTMPVVLGTVDAPPVEPETVDAPLVEPETVDAPPVEPETVDAPPVEPKVEIRPELNPPPQNDELDVICVAVKTNEKKRKGRKRAAKKAVISEDIKKECAQRDCITSIIRQYTRQ